MQYHAEIAEVQKATETPSKIMEQLRQIFLRHNGPRDFQKRAPFLRTPKHAFDFLKIDTRAERLAHNYPLRAHELATPPNTNR